MERNKWEDEFKNKLNQREIAPTPHAWDRLDAMLNEADSKTHVVAQQNPIRKLNWLYIAAGIAAFLLTATVFFTQGKGEQRNEVVIEEKQKSTPVEMIGTDSAGSLQEQPQIQVAERNVAPGQIEASNKLKRQSPTFDRYSNQSNSTFANTDQIADAGVQNAHIDQSSVNNPILSSQSNDPEIASAEMTSPKGVKVDPRSLLSQVDGELDMTFREKTIKKLGRKYQNVKVALANRNNQE